MKKSLRLTVVAVVLALTAALGVAPAQAQTGWFGGIILLSAKSNGYLKIGGGLRANSNGTYTLRNPIRWLYPGQSSRYNAGIYDADGFQAPYGCRTTVYMNGGYWSARPGTTTKINDLTTAMVTVRC